MLRRSLRIALRRIRRRPGAAAIHIVGLTAGIASCLLIGVFVRHELSYDRFHDHADRIVRVVSTFQGSGEGADYASVPAPLGPALEAVLPEVEAVARLRGTAGEPPRVSAGQKSFWEPRFFYADASFFEVFSFDLLKGDPATALGAPFAVVLTEQAARRYFGTADPLGQTLTVAGQGLFTVTGVMADVPAASHVHFDLVASLATDAEATTAPHAWKNSGYYTYALLTEGASAEAVEARVPGVLATAMPTDEPQLFAYTLQPLTRIHLHSHRRQELEPNGRIGYVYFFGGVALLILLVACLNYANLAVAQGFGRAREVGVRKAVGARRGQLVALFLGETAVLFGISLVLAYAAAYALLPPFADLMERPLFLRDVGGAGWAAVLGAVVLVGLAAAGYPAAVLAAFRPARVLKGPFRPGAMSSLRKGMVVAQLAVATVLLIGTLAVRQQLRFVSEQPLGMEVEQVVALPMNGDADVLARYPALKAAFLQHASVRAVTASSGMPGRSSTLYSNPVEVVGQDGAHAVRSLAADEGFAATYDLTLEAGRLPSPTAGGREGPLLTSEFLVNETFVREVGWTSAEDALGRVAVWKGLVRGEVVGVVSDFHFLGLQQALEPVLIVNHAPMVNYLSVRIDTDDVAGALATLEATWQRLLPDHPFVYAFVDAEYARQYRAEQRLADLTGAAALLAVLLAGLGLFGLAAHAAQRRTKEVGIRKALGASVADIVGLLTSEFFKLGLLGLAIAVPVGYLAARRWLADFAYHVELGPVVFALAGAAALAVALAAVGVHALRAATADPVQALRYE